MSVSSQGEPQSPKPVSLRLRALRIDIRERLRGVCVGWPDGEFEALVNRIAEVTLKYEGLATPTSTVERAGAEFIQDVEAALKRINARRAERSDPDE